MTFPFTENTFVKDIVNKIPKTSDIFKQYRIDFCCGGARPLKDAAIERGVDIDKLMAELKAAYEKNEQGDNDIKKWLDADSESLIKHIQEKYHRSLEEELPALSPYVTKVMKVHGEHHPELIKVRNLFFELKDELLEHTKKEDEIVFPMLLQLKEVTDEKERESIINYINELEKEHDHTGDILKELREVTNDFTLPLNACGTFTLVYKRLEALEGETFIHVHLENNVLFPRFLGN